MSDEGLRAAQDKMRDAGVGQPAIDVFTHYYRQVASGATGVIREDDIEPLVAVPRLADVEVDHEAGRRALARTVVIKLNGGLGTSMGLDRAKTLLPVREGRTFLDLIVASVMDARARFGVRLPLLLMDSFRTQDDTLAALAAYRDLSVEGLPLDFVQNSEPKLRADDLTPVVWPADPSLEWCPPGHGDLYTALVTTGVLDRLRAAGYRYASIANADNLGSTPDPRLAGWFAESGAPFALEVCRRTPMDRKGGHLARRRDDGRLVLRESAQTAPEDRAAFADETRHPFFNTNNLWFDLDALDAALGARGSVLGLPLIANRKTVDPSDAASTPVIQLETAMGSAVEVFEGATAIEVGRDRFLPVKTTNELALLRSDAYEVGEDGVPRLVVDAAPVVRLDARYARVGALDALFPHGVPSLREASGLRVEGDWTVEAGVAIVGDVALPDRGVRGVVPAGTRVDAAWAASLGVGGSPASA